MFAIHRLATALVYIVMVTAAGAQTFPSKPLRLIVGFPPGGTTDIVSRVVADSMSPKLGQVVVVDNRPGATGMIGLDLLIKSAGDGYTIGFVASPTLISALTIGKEINVERDLSPLGLIYRQGFLLSVNPSVPEFKGIKSLADLIAVVKANPGKINYSSIGIGSTGHLTGELMASQAGIQWVHVPYKGSALVLQEQIAGQSPIVGIGTSVEDLEVGQGRIVPLAVSSAKRHPKVPNVPTLAESGFAGLDASSWGALIAPGGVPPTILNRLTVEYKSAFDSPQVNEKLSRYIPEYMGPVELGALMRQTIQVWGKVIKDVGIKP